MNQWIKLILGSALVAAIFLLSLTLAAEWAPDNWRLNYIAADNAVNPDIALGPINTGELVVPYVAWEESNKIYAKQWDGNIWKLMPYSVSQDSMNIDPTRAAARPDITVCGALPNSPFAAWEEYVSGGIKRVFVRVWNGTAWQDFGNGSLNYQNTVDATHAALGTYIYLSPYATVWVVWLENNSVNELLTARCNNLGDLWNYTRENGGSFILNRVDTDDAQTPVLAMAKDTPYVTWAEGVGPDNIYVSYWNAVYGEWRPVGNSLNEGTPVAVTSPAIAIDNDYIPYVVWIQVGSLMQKQILVKKYESASWKLVGNPVASGPNIYNPRISVGYNYCLCVTWQEIIGTTHNVRVRYLNGTQWTDMGTSLNIDGSEDALAPEIAALSTDETQNPFVTWSEVQSSRGVFVKRWLTPSITPTQTVTPTITETPIASATPTHSPTPTRQVVTSTPTGSPTSAIEGLVKVNQAAVYPVPASNQATFIFRAGTGEGQVTIRVYNTNHRLVKTLSGEALHGQGRLTWDVSGIAPGVYYYQVQVGEQKLKIEKMVIAR